jgi:hypothetical protein
VANKDFGDAKQWSSRQWGSEAKIFLLQFSDFGRRIGTMAKGIPRVMAAARHGTNECRLCSKGLVSLGQGKQLKATTNAPEYGAQN